MCTASDSDIIPSPSPSTHPTGSPSLNNEWIYVGVAIAIIVAVMITTLIGVFVMLKKCRQVNNQEQAGKSSTAYERYVCVTKCGLQ